MTTADKVRQLNEILGTNITPGSLDNSSEIVDMIHALATKQTKTEETTQV